MHLRGAGAAWNALAARFVHAEFHEEPRHIHHVRRLIHHDHAAGTHNGPKLHQGIVVHRGIQRLGRYAPAGWPARLNGFDRPPVRSPATHLLDNLAQRRAHRNLDKPGIGNLARQRKYFGAFALLCPNRAEPIGALANNRRNVRKGLDVVDQRRTSVQALLGGERRTRTRSAALAFDRRHQSGFLAANESPRANSQINIETEWGFQDAAAQQSGLLGLLNRGLKPGNRQRILGPHVYKALARSNRVSGNGHALQHRVRIALQHAPIHKRARIPFIRIANHIFLLRLGLGHRRPLQPGGITRAATTAQTTLDDGIDNILGSHFPQGIVQCLVTVRRHVRLDPLGINNPAIAKNDAQLVRKERTFGIHLFKAGFGPLQGADHFGRILSGNLDV